MADMDGDGIDDAIEGQVRLLMMAAGQAGEAIARLREEQLRRAERQSQQEARELQSRFEAERAAARIQLADVHRDDYWQQATPEQIAQRYQIARAWEREDPVAEQASRRIESEVHTRYGVDAADLGRDPEAARQAMRLEMDRAERDRAQAERERVEAQVLLNQANRDDQRADQGRAAAEHEPDPDDRAVAAEQAEQHQAAAEQNRDVAAAKYDSAERRDATAAELRAKGISESDVDVKMSVDASHGKPATAAVQGGPRNAPKARKKPTGRGQGQQRASRHQ